VKSRLERSNSNKVIAGVCGGLAEYLAVDPTLVRVAFVVMTFVGGIGILAYIVMLILMPQPGQPAPFTKTPPSTVSTDATARMDADSSATAQPTTVTPVDPAVQQAEAERRRSAVGYLLIALGVVFLLSNEGAFRLIQWNYVWPLFLIALGALFLVQRVRS
jgi:phage shock protein C